jgi:hypothetical protein
MIAFRLFAITAMAAAGLSVRSDTVSSAATSSIGAMPSKTAVFSEAIRLVPRNFSTLVLVHEETFVVDFSSLVTPVPLPEEGEEEEQTVVVLETPLPFPTEDPTDSDSTSYCGKLLQGSYGLASSLWQGASHFIAFSREQVYNKDGSAIEVAKVSFQICSARLTVTLETGIVNDPPKAAVPVRFLSPEIIRILSKQCPLISPSEPTCAMDVTKPLTRNSITNVLAWFANTKLLQAPLIAFRAATTALSGIVNYCMKSSVPARFVSPEEIIRILSKQCPLIESDPTCKADAMDGFKSWTRASVKNVLAWFANTRVLHAPRIAKADAMEQNTKPLTRDPVNNVKGWLVSTLLLQAPRIAYHYGRYALILGVIAFIVGASILAYVYVHALTVLFSLMLGYIQWNAGYFTTSPFGLCLQVGGTVFASRSIAKYMAAAIWRGCVVVIHAFASTMQATTLGPFYIAFEFAKKALFVGLKGLFKIVKNNNKRSFFSRYIVRDVSMQTADGTCILALRHALTCVLIALLCENQWKAGYFTTFFRSSLHLIGTVLASRFIAKYMADAIWRGCAAVIHAFASTMEATILGPFRTAFASAMNALFAVLRGHFKIVKLKVFAAFGAFRMTVDSFFADEDDPACH